MMNTEALSAIALVPLRGEGKSRLDTAIGPEGRGKLVEAMLDDVVVALRAGGVEDILILAGDARAGALAEARGLHALKDPNTVGGPPLDGDARLRAAVDAALMTVPSDRVRLVVAADLPRLSAAEVAAVLVETADVTVVPTSGGGTALLRLARDVTLTARYGHGSAGAHLRAADAAGYSNVVLDLPGARNDVDAVEDLDALDDPLDGHLPGAATTAFIAEAAR